MRGLSKIGTIVGLICCLGLLSATVARAQPAAEIVLTLDVSGSIDNGELAVEIDGLKTCINNPLLIPQNGNVAIGIVVYADGSATALAMTSFTGAGVTAVNDALDDLLSDRIVGTGSTDIGSGVNRALTLFSGNATQEFILLVGDGASNQGNTGAACDAAANAGVIICAIAVASDQAGQDELQACALTTGGSFGVADTFEDFGPVCERCLEFFFICECQNPVVPNDPGLCSAVVDCDQILSCVDLFGDSIPDGSLSCNPASPYPVGVTPVTITVQQTGQQFQCSVTVVDTEPPVAICPPDTVVECDGLGNVADFAAWQAQFGATDNCPGVVPVLVVPPLSDECGATGSTTGTMTATDAAGNVSQCSSTFTIVDTTPPDIQCNVGTGTVFPGDAPITFTPSASDICCLDSYEITGFRCFAEIGSGKIIDKGESCIVEISADGQSITIFDVGGVGTTIEWTVRAVDCCGNETIVTCQVEAINPGQNK